MLNTSLSSAVSLHDNSSIPEGYHGPPLWYHYPECEKTPYCFIFYYGVKVLNFFVGSPSNILVVWQIASKKKNSSTSDVFIFNLALLDAYFCLMTPIELLNRMLWSNDYVWYFQRFAYGVKDLTPLFLVCICIDRYMAVVHPVIFSRYRDNMARTAISVVVWILIIPYSLTKSILGVVSVTDVFSGVILFAFAVMVFCNISVIWVLRHSVAGKEVMHPVKKKALKMVLKNLAIIMVNYLTPVATMPFVSVYTNIEYRCFIGIIVFSIMDLSCVIEPLLYITQMEKLNVMCCREVSTESLNNKVVSASGEKNTLQLSSALYTERCVH